MIKRQVSQIVLTVVFVCTHLGSGLPLVEPQTEDGVLTNEQVIEMVKAKLSPSLIISQIRNSKTKFDLSTKELIRLSAAQVPESIIAVMRNPQAMAAAGGPAAPGGSPGKSVKLADGEKVRLVLMEDISSATANHGDRINFTVAEEVKVGEFVVIAKGAAGRGSVAAAKKKGMLGQGGKLTIAMEGTKAVDGQNVRIRATAGREGDDKMGKTVAVAVLAGPFAVLVKGKDIVAPKGTEYTAYIDESKEIIVSQ
ncbi:MAG: hypothetical protein HY820_41510 [Acidobacteria bacterium]|nr:hypothetical protein [Acidobacteriota bacterium]